MLLPLCTRVAVAVMTMALPAPIPENPTLDAKARASAIEGVLRCLNEGYVFPEMAKKMETATRERAGKKEYDALIEGDALAARLTRDLQAVSNDRHVRVSYSPSVLPPEPKNAFAPPPGWQEEMRRVLARDNYGFSKAEILKGNIGYLRCDYFAPPEIAGDTYAAAMNYLTNTDALIIDLRTGSGSMSMDAIPMICGYLFGNSVHLNDVYWRHDDSTRQTWSWAHVPGKKYLDKPIYLLTSGRTFSGSEEIAYDLKNLKRATLVGDVTGGGANGGGSRRADDHFEVWVPNGRAINPITKTNWEGVGVSPDVAVPAAKALETAHLLALQQVMMKATEPQWKEKLQSVIAEQSQVVKRYKKVTFTLKGYPDAKSVMVAGAFNYWSLRTHPLTKQGERWVAEIEMEPGRQPYKFIVDDEWILDPANKETEQTDEHKNSVLIVR